MNKLNVYEKKQLKDINSFKSEEPGVIGNAFGILMTPLTWLVNKVVPEAAVRGALSASHSAAK